MLILVISCQLGVSKVLKVCIVVPVLEIVALCHIPSHLVQDAQIRGVVLRAELLTDLHQQLDLISRQILVFNELIDIVNCTVFLDSAL